MGSNAQIHLGEVYQINLQVKCRQGFETNQRNTATILHDLLKQIILNYEHWNITYTTDYDDENTGEVQT